MITFTKARKQPPKRRFVDVSSDDVFWQTMHRLADKQYLPLRQLILSAWGDWRNDLDIDALFSALLAGNTAQALFIAQRPWTAAANKLLPKVQELLAETVAESAQATIPTIEAQVEQSTGAQVGIRFGGPASREVQNWVSQHSTRLITQIGEGERAAIRDLLLDGVRNGRTPIQVSHDIRQYIGLTRPQSATIIRLRSTMEASGIKSSLIEQRIDARVRKMIRQRASIIARNESITASLQGQRAAYLQGVEQGYIDLNTARRFWMVSPDERLCPQCSPIPSMNNQGRRLDEPYSTPVGPLMIAHAHVSCRCVERLEL